MRRPFIFTSLGVVRGESKRGNRKCGPENKQFFKHLSRELAENLSLKGNKNHLLGSTNLLVKTAQFTKQILLIITSVSLFFLHKSVYKCDLNNFLEMFLTTWPPQG